MSSAFRPRLLGGVACVLLLLAGCGDKDKDKAKEASGLACSSDIDKTASQPLPADVPSLAGSSVYRFDSQGQTKVWFAAVDGTPEDLVKIRDQADDALKSKGYTIKDSDQEPGAEAESEFAGPHEGTTNVRPLCKGKVVIRYKLES